MTQSHSSKRRRKKRRRLTKLNGLKRKSLRYFKGKFVNLSGKISKADYCAPQSFGSFPTKMHICLEDVDVEGLEKNLDHIWITFPITHLDDVSTGDTIHLEGKVTKYVKKDGVYSIGIEMPRLFPK